MIVNIETGIRSAAMVDRMDEELNRTLMKRAAVQAPEGLAERIIARAYRDEAERQKSVALSWPIRFRLFFEDMGRVFVIPRPVYACALMMVLGLLAGVWADPVLVESRGVSGDDGDVAAYMFLDESAAEAFVLWDESGEDLL